MQKQIDDLKEEIKQLNLTIARLSGRLDAVQHRQNYQQWPQPIQPSWPTPIYGPYTTTC